jgi:bifunctional DNase/RNase
MVMPAVTDTGFMEMRLAKVVGIALAGDERQSFVVLEGVSQDRQLPIAIGETEAFHMAASLTRFSFPRPMTAQFAAGLLRAVGGRVRQVRIDRLIPTAAGGTAYGATVEVEGSSGVQRVDARPSDALNLVALLPAPVVVAPEVLADAEATLEENSPEAASMRLALQAEQMTIYGPAGQ